MPQISQLSMVFASQLFWLAIFFGLIFAIVGRRMVPKIRSTIILRQEKIAEDIARAQAARDATEQGEAAWRARMDAARMDAARIADQAKRESDREAEVRLKSALEEIDANVARARLRIRASVDAARAELEVAAVEAAQQIVEQLIGVKVDPDHARRAVAAEFGSIGRPAEHLQTDARTSEPATPVPVAS